MAELYNSIKGWIKEPFNSQMSLWGWILIVGVFIVASIFWSIIITHITRLIPKEV